MSNFHFFGVTSSARSSFRLGLQATARSSSRNVSELCAVASARSCFSTAGGRRPDEYLPLHTRLPRRTATTIAQQWRRPTMRPILPPIPLYPSSRQQQRRTLFSQVYRNYVELPPNYRDEEGLPYQSKELTQADAINIFGPRLSTERADRLLRILHGRRVAGTLEDPAVAAVTAQFSEKDIAAALAFLRRTVPVEEIINAGLRAEDELRELEEAARLAEEEQQAATAAADGQEEGAGTPTARTNTKPTPAPGALSGRFQKLMYKTTPTNSVYGEGVFDKVRSHNEAAWEQEKAQREEEMRLKEEEEARLNPGGLQPLDASERRALSPMMQKWTDNATSDLEEPPPMSTWQRLWPTYAVCVTVVAGGLLLASTYAPPQKKHRVWPDIPPAFATLAAIIGINVLVYLAWKVPPLWWILNRNFIFIPAMANPRALVGSFFSHQFFKHLVGNSFFLWILGTRLHDDVGRGDFLATFFGIGVLAFAGTQTQALLKGTVGMSTLGASGVVNGLGGAYFTMHPFDGFKIFGLPPDPYNGIQGLAFLSLMFLNAVLPAFSKNPFAARMDVWCHISGLVAGVGYGLYFNWRDGRLKKAEAIKREKGVVTEHNVRLTGDIIEEKPEKPVKPQGGSSVKAAE